VIVRKSTATVLHEIAELVFDSRAVPWLVLMCERAMTDPEPQLRAAAMTLTWHLAEHLPNAFLGDASQGSRSLRRLPSRTDPTFAEVYLLQCKLLPVATRLAEDRAPSVRLAVAAQCDRLCNALGEHWGSVIIDVLQALLGDSDERVRCEAILCVPRLVETVIESHSRDGPTDGGVEVLQALLPVSIKLQKDLRSSVRAALATAAGELLTLLVGLDNLEEIPTPNSNGEVEVSAEPVRRYKKYVDETLIPLVQQLLHDTDPEVTSSALRAVTNASRGTVREMRTRRTYSEADDDTMSLSSFHSMTSIDKKEPVFIPVLSEAQVLRLLPTLAGLANNKRWRVRQGAVEIVPALLGCTNDLDTRSKIAELCISLMRDHVDAVRRTAAECLCLGAGALGSHGEDKSREWISSIVIPHTRECASSSDSKQRMLSLKMIEVMLTNGVGTVGSASSFGSEMEHASPLQELLDVAVSLSTDRVANVRLNVGRVLGNILHVLDDSELSLVINALKRQLEEEEKQPFGGDRDVVYFAKRAISRSQARLEEGSMSTPENMRD
jgi:HEAT repeat protein